MKPIYITMLMACSLSFLALAPARAQTITEWTFENDAVAANPTPAPSIGSGTASTLGMVNSYSSGNTSDISDIKTATGTDTDNMGTTNEWRVRGTNGWNSAAPIGTQGTQFNVSTAGYANISLRFDLDISTQGEADVQVQYTINGTTWINAALTYAGANGSVMTNSSNSNIVTGSYLGTSIASPSSSSNWFNGITANLSGVSGVNNDSNFGIRIVNAATGTSDVALKTSQGQINNTSGNWALDDVQILGIAAPEPSTYALILGSFAMLVGVQTLRRRNFDAKF